MAKHMEIRCLVLKSLKSTPEKVDKLYLNKQQQLVHLKQKSELREALSSAFMLA